MKRDHLKWGPKFPRYFNSLDDRLESAFNDYVDSKENTSVAHEGLMPLSLLETTLSVGENMHRIDYQHGEKSLPVLMTTIRRYTELNDTGIFHYYYGYLCIRHIIRAICIGTLIESESLDDFLDELDPEFETAEASKILAFEAIEHMTDALFTKDVSQIAKCLGYDSSHGNAFLE
ncbi:hypothetical protein FRC07_013488, partial [Ceratobasidium sp. 392]